MTYFLLPKRNRFYRKLKNIAASKNEATKAKLREVYRHLKSRYSEYAANESNLAAISSCSVKDAGQRDALLHCYASETKELGKLKAHIKENYISNIGLKCQFCGIENVTTFDHYLPKESFPDFSVHAQNLIPCCNTCNNKKRAAFLTSLGERAIINIYFEVLPNDKYLHSVITYKNDSPIADFYLEQPDSYSDYQFRLVSEHFSKLGLLERFRENAPEVMSETRVSIISHAHPESEAIVKDWLEIEARNFSERYSVNNWKVALFYAMAECDEFVRSCLSCL